MYRMNFHEVLIPFPSTFAQRQVGSLLVRLADAAEEEEAASRGDGAAAEATATAHSPSAVGELIGRATAAACAALKFGGERRRAAQNKLRASRL